MKTLVQGRNRWRGPGRGAAKSVSTYPKTDALFHTHYSRKTILIGQSKQPIKTLLGIELHKEAGIPPPNEALLLHELSIVR